MRAADLLARLGSGERLPFEVIRTALSPSLPLLHALDTTPQDAQWHAEGHVAAHCALVVGHAHTLADGAGLTGHDRAALLLAAALHDVGKALTTREEADDAGVLRIRSPRHARRGRDYLAYRLLDTGLPPGLILTVLRQPKDADKGENVVLLRRGKLYLADLAGSERINKSGAANF